MFHKVMALSTLVLQCWFFKKIKMLTLVLVHFELGSCSDFIPTEDPKPKLGNLSVTNWGRNSLHLQRLVGPNPKKQSVQVVCSRRDKC